MRHSRTAAQTAMLALVLAGLGACSADAPARPGDEGNGPGTGAGGQDSMSGPGDGPSAGGGDAPGGPGNVPPDSSAGPSGTDPGGPGGPRGPVAEPPTQGDGVAAVSNCVDPDAIGPTPIRRISSTEYVNAARDVFGASVNPGDLPADEKLGAFTANVASPLVRDNVDRYFFVARQIATDVVADFAARSGCASTADTACVDGWLKLSARRAFHGTLEASDTAHLDDLFAALAPMGSDLAVQTAIEFILSSPRFLYLVELGDGGQTLSKLTGSEIAGRLAAFLWRSVPDVALLQAADDGTLDAPEGVKTWAANLLSDARAVPVLESFVREWLRLEGAAPGASTLEQQIAAQPAAWLAQATTDASLSFDDLVAGDSAPLGAELASMYGATVDGSGQATLPPERRGLLLSASFLSSNASGSRPSPVKRGFIVRRSLLCEAIPPPNDPVAMQLPEVMAGVTEQQAFNQHSADPGCWTCHQFMDPLGDAFGMYDAEGAYDPSLATTTGGTVYFTGSHEPSEVAFADTQELLTLLQQDPAVRQCFVLQFLRFALGRGETADDACGVDAINTEVGEELSVQELLIQIAGSTSFMNRNPVTAGGTCR